MATGTERSSLGKTLKLINKHTDAHQIIGLR